jgi:hypothetical protein
MRSTLAVFALAIPLSSFAQTNSNSNKLSADDEHQVIQIEQELVNGLLAGDVSPFGRYLADSSVLTDPDGTVMDKSRILNDIKSGDLKLQSSKPDDMKVRMYGDMAVATYGSTDKGSYKGKDIRGRFRWTDVFVKRNGRWQIVAGQGT